MAELFAVHPERIGELWVQVRPFIERAMDRSNYDEPADVYEALREERAQLWIIWTDGEIDGVVVTQIELTPKAKSCGIWIMTGNGRENWEHLVTEIEAWAKREGCTMMRHHARPGWSRVLKPYGYEMTHVILEKAL